MLKSTVAATTQKLCRKDPIEMKTTCDQRAADLMVNDNNNLPRGVMVSTLDSESSDRGSNPREAFSHRVVERVR